MYKKHIILFILLISILSSTTIISYAEEKEKYPDVSPNNWYYEYVTELSDLGFINGYPDGLFHPEKTITNGEYFTLLFRVLNIDLEMYKKETDTHWASAATRKADYLDLSMQIKNTNDYINSAIDRKHAIKTTLKAIGLNDVVNARSFEYPFKDIEDKNLKLFKDWIVNGYILGIIEGDSQNNFNPNDTLTRAQASKILYNVYKLTEENKIIEMPMPQYMNGFNYKLIGETSSTHLSSMVNAISYFPKHIQEELKLKSSILITNEPQNKYISETTTANGCYFNDTNKIIIFTQDNPKSLFFGIDDTVVHEIGHFLWDEILTTNERNQITKYFLEDNILNEKNANEFWAELVRFYVLPYHNYKLEKFNPNLIELVESILTEEP